MGKKKFLTHLVLAAMVCGAWGSAMAETPDAPMYNHVITGDMAVDQAWQDAGVLSKEGEYVFTGTEGQTIQPNFTEPVHEGVYTVIAPKADKKDILIKAKEGRFSIVADGTGLAAGSKLYGIYNNKDAVVDLDMHRKTQKAEYEITVTAADDVIGAGIYASAETGTATVLRDRQKAGLKLVTTGKGLVGAEAGKNGMIVLSGIHDVNIISNGNYALKATDGGYIAVRGHVKANDHAAIYAANGGEVHYGYLCIPRSRYLLEGSGSNLTGDVVADEGGLIDINLKFANWTGNSFGDGAVNLKTNDEDSYWNGSGTISEFEFMGGATWNINSKSGLENRVKHLQGPTGLLPAGVIRVNENDSVQIDSLDGKVIVGIEHDAANPVNIKSGQITIGSAGEGAEITMRTDATGIDTENKELVQNVLDNLAKKLTYTGYINGERNLHGLAEISEGLTSRAIVQKRGDIVFNEKTGQGEKAVGSVKLYTDIITGNPEVDVAYKDVINADGVYTFDKDTMIETLITKPRHPSDTTSYGSITNNYDNDYSATGSGDTHIDMQGHDLTINTIVSLYKAPEASLYPYYYNAAINAYKSGTIVIDNPGAIDIDIAANYYYAAGIRAATSGMDVAKVYINNDNSPEHRIKIYGRLTEGSIWDINYWGIFTNQKNEVHVSGLADMESYCGVNLWARGGFISVGGGKFNAIKYDAFQVISGGKINVNVDEDENGNFTPKGNPVQVHGGLTTRTKYYGCGGDINVAFVTPDSYFEGVAIEPDRPNTPFNIRLWMQNGATWNNRDREFRKVKMKSHVTEFFGSEEGQERGLVIQRQKGNLQIDNYHGNTVFAFDVDPDKSDVTLANGGDIIIKNAHQSNGKNAMITLIREAGDIDIQDEAQVKAGLNKLANKLYYKGYAKGERNLDAKAEISEGLTSYSAAWVKRSDVSFKEKNGQGYVDDEAAVTTNPNPQEGPRPAVVNVGKDDPAKTMNKYYAKDNQLYIFEHNAKDPAEVYGGDLTIGTAEKDSHIRLRTDNDGIDIHDVDQVRDALNGLAGKLYYKGYVDGERNLRGQAEIAEGLTAKSAMMKFGDIQYRAEDGHGYFEDIKGIHTANPEIIYGPKETAMMRGAKSAMTGAMLTWREENNDLNKRLGEIRYGGAEAGAWGRIYGGKAKYDKDNASYNTDFKAVQVGYDRMVNDEWRAGVAFSYIDGDNSYKLGGDGTTNLASLALYGTKVADDGSYFDIVAKGSRVDTDYTVYNHEGKKLSGDYKTNGFTLSAEYGKRIDQGNGLYLIPQAELIYGHLASEDYDAVSTYAQGKKMHVEQGSFTSVVGRIGVSVGKETETTNLYAKASLLHEFDGKVTTTYKAAGEPVGRTEQDFGDTWFVLGIGGTHKLNADQYLYGNLERSFGGDVETEWRADLGIRWLF